MMPNSHNNSKNSIIFIFHKLINAKQFRIRIIRKFHILSLIEKLSDSSLIHKLIGKIRQTDLQLAIDVKVTTAQQCFQDPYSMTVVKVVIVITCLVFALLALHIFVRYSNHDCITTVVEYRPKLVFTKIASSVAKVPGNETQRTRKF